MVSIVVAKGEPGRGRRDRGDDRGHEDGEEPPKITAPAAGTVEKLAFGTGAQVKGGDLVLVLG